MSQKELIKKLQSLRTIEPNEEFARVSRSVVLTSKEKTPLGDAAKQSILSRGLSFALSLTLATAFLLVLVLGNTTGSFKTLFLPTLPGVNDESLVSEADAITNDINIQLSSIKYFEQSRRTVAVADESPLPGSPDVLIDDEGEIDKLLDEIIDY